MKPYILKYGLLAGLIVSLFMSISMITMSKAPEIEGGPIAMIIGYASMLLAFLLIIVAIKKFRDNENGGVISFGKAFTIGLLITLIAATMYVITWAIVYHFFLPDFMDRYIAAALKRAGTTATSAELEKMTAEMNQQKELYKNPLYFAAFTYMEILPVGLLVSLISAFVLKRKQK